MATKFNTKAIQARVEQVLNQRFHAVGTLLANHTKLLLSTEGTSVRQVAKRVVRGGALKVYRKGSLIYNASPSLPGQPPHLQTGRLRASIAYAVGHLLVRVGTSLKYARALEFGSEGSRLAARPFLRRALAEKIPEIRKILTAPIGSFTNPIDVNFR